MIGRGARSRLHEDAECPKCHEIVRFVAIDEPGTDSPGGTTVTEGPPAARGSAGKTGGHPRWSTRTARSRKIARRRRQRLPLVRRKGAFALVLTVVLVAVAGAYFLLKGPLAPLSTASHRSAQVAQVTGQRGVLLLERPAGGAGQYQYTRMLDVDYPQVGQLPYTVEWQLALATKASDPESPYSVRVRCVYTLEIDNNLNRRLTGVLTSASKTLAPHWTDALRGEEQRRFLRGFASYVAIDDQAGFPVPSKTRTTRRGTMEFDAPDVAAANRIVDFRFDLTLRSDQLLPDLVLDAATRDSIR